MTLMCAIQVTGSLRDFDHDVAFMLDISGCRYGGMILVKPSSLDLELNDEAAMEVGVSQLEAEATGIDALMACKRMNTDFGGGLVLVETENEKMAIERLFARLNVEICFLLESRSSTLKAS